MSTARQTQNALTAGPARRPGPAAPGPAVPGRIADWRAKNGYNVRVVRWRVNRKVFWLVFVALSLMADWALPLVWGLLATFPILAVSWWVAYRSGWF